MDVGTFHAGLQPDENIWNLGNIVVSFYDMLEPVLDIVERNMCWHRWFSGRMLACHAGGPGSIPGRCIFFFLSKMFCPPYLNRIDVVKFSNFKVPHDSL